MTGGLVGPERADDRPLISHAIPRGASTWRRAAQGAGTGAGKRQGGGTPHETLKGLKGPFSPPSLVTY